MAIAGDPKKTIGKAFCDALGLDANKVRGLNIRMYVNDVVTITVEYYPHTEIEALTPILKRYKLEPIDD